MKTKIHNLTLYYLEQNEINYFKFPNMILENKVICASHKKWVI